MKACSKLISMQSNPSTYVAYAGYHYIPGLGVFLELWLLHSDSQIQLTKIYTFCKINVLPASEYIVYKGTHYTLAQDYFI